MFLPWRKITAGSVVILPRRGLRKPFITSMFGKPQDVPDDGDP
jgi:hypothetical protein